MEVLVLLLIVALYVFSALCLQRIADKTGQAAKSWFAWVPIANVVLTCWIAGKPGWWTVLMFVPFVNIVISLILWFKVAEACKKPGWLGLIVVLVPVGNLAALGVLAFSK